VFQQGIDDQFQLDVEGEQRERQVPQPASRLRWFTGELRGRRYIDVTKDTQFTDAWLILGILLTLVGLATNSRFLTTAAACLFTIAGVGWAWNRLSLFGLEYRRRLSETRAFTGETVELTLEVRNRKFLPVTWLQITDIFPSALPMDNPQGILEQVHINRTTNLGEFTTFWSIGAFGRLTRRFTVHCTRRGYHPYGPAVLSTGDGFGMFSHKGKLPEQQRLIVYPRLYSVAELRLPAKNPFGECPADARLVEDPLRTAGIREWQPTDGLKRVHWKATARHQSFGEAPRDLLSRVYEPSQEPQMLIFLNVATMERHWLGQLPELMERAVSVAGSLAALCSELRLPVGMIVNGYLPGSDQPLRILPGRSPDQLLHILELLAAVTGFAAQPIEELLLRDAPRLPWGSTLLIVTAVAHDGLLATLLELQRAGRKVMLFTLAEKPPAEHLSGMTVYHLPHLVEDLIAPVQVQDSFSYRTWRHSG